MSDQLEIRYVPLSQVSLWERNPKRHSIGDLAVSIERYGFKMPPRFEPTLNNGQGGIVAGNGRIETLAALHQQGRPAPRGIEARDGEWLIPILFGVDAASQEIAEAFGIDDNNLGLAGGDFTPFDMARMWDASYTDILAGLATADALPITVDGDALDALLAGMVPEPEAQEGDDDAPAIDLDKPTRVQPGDVWRVGAHIVACLDSTTRENVEKWVRGVSFVVADPPYGVDIVATDVPVGGGERYNYPFGGVGDAARPPRRGYVGGGQRHHDKTGRYYIQEREGLGSANGAKPFGSKAVRGSVGAANVLPVGKYMPVIGDETTDTAIDAALLSLELYPKAVQFWWGANYYANALPPASCWIVWDKENTGNFADAELAWSNHDSAVRIFKHMWNGMLRASERERRTHPTQKPVALFLWLYERYGKPGDVIFDPFLGSGPSLKAAHRMGDRTVVGFELSPHYCTHVIEWAESNGLTCERITE